MYLNGTADLLQVVTASAGDIEVVASYVDYDDPSTVTANRTNTASITTATTTTIVAGAASVIRNPVKINIFNNHASVSNLISVLFTDGSIVTTLRKLTLLPNECLEYDGKSWIVYDVNGLPKLANAERPSGISTIAAIASHSADTYYLGYPVAGRLVAGCFFRWSWRSTKGAAGTAAPTYIIRFGTAGTTGDTARLTLTGTAQTAAADSAKFLVEVGFRVIGASAVIQGSVWIDHFLAITGFTTTVNHHAMVEGTSASFDSSPANSIIGLSVNPGASGAWVSNLVTLDAVNILA
jgi:hypothetical protein